MDEQNKAEAILQSTFRKLDEAIKEKRQRNNHTSASLPVQSEDKDEKTEDTAEENMMKW
ncbi:MAG: hypothetical protein KQH63_19350 [Desulfobulbaceae bacterium]|nr:hypothetical protein [Desulfobulbaceae bacterium]